jgi:hypothetical protein
MLQFESFASLWPELKVCQLQKNLYGLKQSSRVWSWKFNDFFTKFNLHPIEVDPYVYSKRKNHY